MDYLKRYHDGEYEQVWSDLQALGPTVRQEPHFTPAREVAAETMRRVRRNCQLLVSRLRSARYVFGVYPDGSRGYYTQGPLVPPSDRTRSDCADLEAPPALVIESLTHSPVDCFGNSSGSATVVVSGGEGNYTYAWNDSLAQIGPQAIFLSSATYQVVITDENGCQVSGEVFVTQPDPVSVSTAVTDASCNGYFDGTNLTAVAATLR